MSLRLSLTDELPAAGDAQARATLAALRAGLRRPLVAWQPRRPLIVTLGRLAARLLRNLLP